MQNWSCMHPCGHSSIKFLWSRDTRAQDSFFLFKSTQCFQNMFFYQFVHSSESILGQSKFSMICYEYVQKPPLPSCLRVSFFFSSVVRELVGWLNNGPWLMAPVYLGEFEMRCFLHLFFSFGACLDKLLNKHL